MQRFLVKCCCFLLWISVAHTSEWNLNTNGDWNVDVNWINPATFPNAQDAIAELLNVITGNRTITLRQDITIGMLHIDDNNRYTIGGSDTLTFSSSSGTSYINITMVNGRNRHRILTPVYLSNDLVVNQQATRNFRMNRVISGPGALIKDGPGALFINPPGSNTPNTYTGGTVINQGVLGYWRGAIPPGSHTVINGGRLEFRQSMLDASAFSIEVRPGGVIDQGRRSSIVCLNRLTGQGETRLATRNAQAFELFRGVGPYTFDGQITGGVQSSTSDPNAGSLLRLRLNAEVTLTGSNTYTCRTYVEDSSCIYVQNDQALGLGSSQGGSAAYTYNSGSYIFNPPSGGLCLDKTFFLNGTGLTHQGALHNMLGNNVIQGDIQIGWSGGAITEEDVTVCVDPGTSLSFLGSVTGAQNLTFNCGGDVVYGGSSPNTFSGQTVISAGKLLLQKPSGVPATSGETLVQSAGHLAGSGLLGGTTTVHGTIEPGSVTSQIQVTGDLNLEPGSTYIARLDPVHSSLTSATGNINISDQAILDLRPLIDSYPAGTTWVLMNSSSGQVNGQFNPNNIQFPAFFSPEITYDGQNVILQIMDAYFLQASPCDPNARAVAHVINHTLIPPNSDLEYIYTLLQAASLEQLCCALNQMQPSLFKGFIVLQEYNILHQRQTIGQRLKRLCYEDDLESYHFWIEGKGDFFKQNVSGVNVGLHAWSGYVMTGVDMEMNPVLVVGAAAGYSYSSATWQQERGNGEIQSGYVSFYGTGKLGDVAANLILLGSFNFYDQTRRIYCANIGRQANSNVKGDIFEVHFDASRKWVQDAGAIAPFLSFDYFYSHQDSFQESGAQSLDLLVQASHNGLLRGEVGLFLTLCSFYAVMDLKLSYIRQDSIQSRTYTAQLVGTSNKFTTPGIEPVKNLFSPVFTMAYTRPCTSNCTSLRVSAIVGAEIGSNFWDQYVGVQAMGQF